jgi:preprotein translocase subunit YajC
MIMLLIIIIIIIIIIVIIIITPSRKSVTSKILHYLVPGGSEAMNLVSII